MEYVELVESCKRYDVAPEEAFQLSVKEVGSFVDPFAGEASTGAEGADGGALPTVDCVQLDPPFAVR